MTSWVADDVRELRRAVDELTSAEVELERSSSRIKHCLEDTTAEPVTTLRLVMSRLLTVRTRLELTRVGLAQLHQRAAELVAKGERP